MAKRLFNMCFIEMKSNPSFTITWKKWLIHMLFDNKTLKYIFTFDGPMVNFSLDVVALKQISLPKVRDWTKDYLCRVSDFFYFHCK